MTFSNDEEMKGLDKKTRVKLELLNATCKNLPIVMYTTDLQGLCTHSGGKDEIMLGDMQPKDLKGKKIQDIFPDKQSILTVHESALKGYHGSYEWFLENIAIQVYVRPYFNDNGVIDGTICVGIDVSESRWFEKQLIESRQNAEKALRFKSEFLNVMSHEIRTPLNAIIGLSHLMSEESSESSQTENLQLLKYSAENLLALINDVLDYGKLESGKANLDLRPVNLIQLVQSVIRALDVKAKEKSLLLKCIHDNDIPFGIMADSTRINQILNNLVSNAIKFTHEGYVTLRLLHRKLPGNKVAIRFLVEDTGIGIQEDRLDQIFDEFVQADNRVSNTYGGTGLGLSISKFLVELMGGNLKVASTIGKGSVFQFELIFERVNLQSSEAELIDPIDKPNKLEQIKVLLVDDNNVNRKIAARFLKKWNMQVTEAADGQEAYNLTENSTFDVILMDLQMPIMDGYEAAEKIIARNRTKKIYTPILAVTADTKDDVLDSVKKSGMIDLVSKPFKPDELFLTINKAVSIKS